MLKMPQKLSSFLAILAVAALVLYIQLYRVQNGSRHQRRHQKIRASEPHRPHQTNSSGRLVKTTVECSSSSEEEEECQLHLVESLPEGLFSPKEMVRKHMSMDEAWLRLINSAQFRIDIVSYHWGLQRGSGKGQQVYDAFVRAVQERKVQLRIVHTTNHGQYDAYDAVSLARVDPTLVEVHSVSMPQLIKEEGQGVLHSKLIVSDRKHFYLGSANLSDRSLTKTKELGVLVANCSRLSENAFNLFQVYWHLSQTQSIPEVWPDELHTSINMEHPLVIQSCQPQNNGRIYLGSSPAALCPDGRSDDLSIIKAAIRNADKFIYVAVSDYMPMNVFGTKRSWKVLDDLLREAVLERDVELRMILSERVYTLKQRKPFLFSLMALNQVHRPDSVQLKVFEADMSHFRSAHNKYFVTDKLAYIGTSNWSRDYFSHTAGIGFVLESDKAGSGDLREQLVDVFLRDWNSSHCRSIRW